MLFNKILEKIIKICILENFSKFEVKFVSPCSKSYRLYHTSTQQCGHGPKANMGLKYIAKLKKETKKQTNKTHNW